MSTVYVGSGDFVRYGYKKLYAIKTDSTACQKPVAYAWPKPQHTGRAPATQ